MAIARGKSAHFVDGTDLDVQRLVVARDRAAAALDRVEAQLARARGEAHLSESFHDQLTGALHRDWGRERLGDEVARAHRTGSSLVVAFVDVVGLKRTNDTFGHGAGDLVLAAVGAALVAGLRGYDIVVRYGGDEFVCGLPHSSQADAEHRLREVSEGLTSGRVGIQLTVGFAALENGESLDDVVHRADQAMYEHRRRTGGTRPHRVLTPRSG